MPLIYDHLAPVFDHDVPRRAVLISKEGTTEIGPGVSIRRGPCAIDAIQLLELAFSSFLDVELPHDRDHDIPCEGQCNGLSHRARRLRVEILTARSRARSLPSCTIAQSTFLAGPQQGVEPLAGGLVKLGEPDSKPNASRRINHRSVQNQRILGTRCDRDVLDSFADCRDAEPAIDVTPRRAETTDAGVHRSPLTDPRAIEVLNDPLPLFAPVSADRSPSALEEQPQKKPREEKPHQRCKCHRSTRARFGNSIDPSRGSMIVAQQPHVAALTHVRTGFQFEEIRVPRLVAALAALAARTLGAPPGTLPSRFCDGRCPFFTLKRTSPSVA